jgi:CheY-like chemotaxis protein
MSNVAKPTILIVEDECLVRMVAVDAFLDIGFLVLEAVDAADALRIHGENLQIQVLFTDVNMPGVLNGIDLAEQLKAVAPGLHIIIASALPMIRPVHHIPATFITKPYELDAVCGAVRDLLAA